jgi:phosphoribosylglycinamide formyltransferase-1
MPQLILGFCASHNGSNVRAVLRAISEGAIAARGGIVISNNSKAGVVDVAREFGVPFKHLSSHSFPRAEDLDREILGTLEDRGVELVLLLGYMKLLGPLTVHKFRGRILNIHPALLPRFGGLGMHGLNVHAAVLRSGEKFTGVTIHAVDEQYDHGPIIAQDRVPIEPGDTPDRLAQRVLVCEHQLIAETVAKIAAGEISLPIAVAPADVS